MEDYSYLSSVELGLDNVLLALNEAGYRTVNSCSGHPWGGTSGPYGGYIEFRPGVVDTTSDKENIRSIVEEHTDVPFTIRRGTRDRGRVVFERPLKGSTIHGLYCEYILEGLYPRETSDRVVKEAGTTLEDVGEQFKRYRYQVDLYGEGE